MKKMKCILAIVTTVLSLFVIVSCDAPQFESKTFHEHEYGNWEIVSAPTLTSGGKIKRVCIGNSNHTETFNLPMLNEKDYDVHYTTVASCMNEGKGTFVYEKDGQTISFDATLPIISHDYSQSLVCAMCNVRDPECIEIRTAADLQSIATNPGGKYMLMNNLSLANLSWSGLGTQDTPFSGIFDGGGHEITDIKPPVMKSFGLFSYNTGTIYNLTVRNITYEEKFHVWEGNYGGAIVGYNEGVVQNCNVEGNVHIVWVQTISGNMPSTADNESYTNTAFAGGVVGYNMGKISNCHVGAVLTYGLNPSLKIHMNVGVMLTNATVNLYTTGSYGSLAGYNKGEISSCTATGVYTVNSVSTGQSTSYPLHIGDYHYLHLYTTVNAGGAVGVNAGSIKGCSVKAPKTTMSFVRLSTAYSYEHLTQNTEPDMVVGRHENGGVVQTSVAVQ